LRPSVNLIPYISGCPRLLNLVTNASPGIERPF
jgi:hypothetical protein